MNNTVHDQVGSHEHVTDLNHFLYALRFSKLDDTNIDEELNPFVGVTRFRLDAEHAPWAGNYFSMEKGGIAARWQVNPYEVRDAQLLQLFPKPTGSLAHLSPIEKYDIWKGHDQFEATQYELQRRGPLRDPKPRDWEGFCNGMRCAGSHLPEPLHPVIAATSNGGHLVFEQADLKALAGATYFYVQKYAQVGSPTGEDGTRRPPDPAVFDLVLRYYLAKNNKAFVVDSHTGAETWNESVIGFERVLSAKSELTETERAQFPWAQAKVTVTGALQTLGETLIPLTNGLTQAKVASGEIGDTLPINYTLYLDASDRARAGEWHPNEGTRGVDFAWFSSGRGSDLENGGNPYLKFNDVKQLFNRSQLPLCRQIFM